VLRRRTSNSTFQILFYAIRPGFIRSQKFTKWHAYNFATQFAFNYVFIRALGMNAYCYLIMSSFLAGSLHPCAAHFIAEHYVFPDQRKEAQETASYYGPLNALTYNVGYHQEHHDFPACARPLLV
jgi:sphingolipid delta-4 desaturase